MSDYLSTTPTEIMVFKPTAHMQVWLDKAIELQTDSISEIAEGCSQSRTNWYDWLQIPGFEDWYFKSYKAKRQRWLPKLDAMGMANAKRDYNFWKDMKKTVGDLPEETKTVNNLVGAIQININETDKT